jgi:hypothetical protein
MATGDNFSDWLDQFEYLDSRSIAALPQAQHSLALIHAFAQAANCDGAGSLFYNHTDIVDGVAKAFDEFAEPELAEKIRGVSRTLKPFVAGNPPDWQEIFIEQCMNGAASKDVEQLDSLLQARWDGIYEKIENLARSKGWVT